MTTAAARRSPSGGGVRDGTPCWPSAGQVLVRRVMGAQLPSPQLSGTPGSALRSARTLRRAPGNRQDRQECALWPPARAGGSSAGSQRAGLCQLRKYDRFAVPVAQRGGPPGRADVADPAGTLTEHGHQVPFVAVVGDDRRKRDRPAAPASGDLHHDQPSRPGPAAASRARAALRHLATRLARPWRYSHRRTRSWNTAARPPRPGHHSHRPTPVRPLKGEGRDSSKSG